MIAASEMTGRDGHSVGRHGDGRPGRASTTRARDLSWPTIRRPNRRSFPTAGALPTPASLQFGLGGYPTVRAIPLSSCRSVDRRRATRRRVLSRHVGLFFAAAIIRSLQRGPAFGRSSIRLRNRTAKHLAQDGADAFPSVWVIALVRHEDERRSDHVQEVGYFTQERGAANALAG